MLITDKPVTDYVPLQRNDEVITTQFPMGTIEKLGLLKMDFLGLRTLTVIRDALDLMRDAGVDMKAEDIPLDDKAVYDMISEGETDGVFQLESGGMRSFLSNMKPQNFEDIIAAISLYRPGPMDSIPRYIEGKITRMPFTTCIPSSSPFWMSPMAAWSIRSRSCRLSAIWRAIRMAEATSCAAQWQKRSTT